MASKAKLAANDRYFKKNPEKIRELRAKQRERNRLAYEEFKASLCCEHCGMNDSDCLDFHHRDPTEKEATVASLAQRMGPRFFAEVEKCIVVCANCHRKLHARLKRGEG